MYKTNHVQSRKKSDTQYEKRTDVMLCADPGK